MSLVKLTFKETEELSTNSHDSDNDISESNNSKFITTPIKLLENKTECFPKNEIYSITMRMMIFFRELTILCIIMLTYAAISKDPPKISNTPAAYPFFTNVTFLKDWYKGEISRAIESARSGDVAFVMFYAPWDAESQAARNEFELAAEYMSEHVNFAAVNCWQPHSECRNQYSKVYRWPVLIAYLAHGRGVQYNGPIHASYMIKFLKKVLKPFSLLSTDSPDDFEDAYVIAELNTAPGNLDFAVFYSTTLKYLENDPQYRISFYVKPVVSAKPVLYLHLWNETLIYPLHNEQWTPDSILHWIMRNMHQITAWVSTSGSKSIAISNSVSNGVALILFTPKNVLHFGTDYYTMLQGISWEYYNCNSSVDYKSINMLKRSAGLSNYKNLRSQCNSNISNQKVHSYDGSPFLTNMSNHSRSKEWNSCGMLRDSYSCNVCLNNVKSIDCQEIVPLSKTVETQCENGHFENYKTSSLTGTNDIKSTRSLQKSFQREKCKQFLMAEKLQPALFEKVDMHKRQANISRLSCRSNKSLVFLSMDSLLNHQFAQRLGIDLMKTADKTAAVIIDKRMESHYILQGSINGASMREFIMNYTLNSWNRSFDSMSTLNLGKKRNPAAESVESKVVVSQLNTDSFLPTILQQNKAIAVFYHSKQCTFCNGISHVYLTVSKKLSLVENLLFTRIDGDLNILPWEYSMESYPTILFLPNKRKSESRLYPSSMPMTVSNIAGFILTNLDPEMKLQAIWSLCRHTKFTSEQSSCYSSLLSETLSFVDGTLKYWRKSNKRQKQILLHRLKHLRHLHLLFAHRPEETETIQNCFKNLIAYDNQEGDYRGGVRNVRG